MKTLVAYFSAETGKTRKIAEELSDSLKADLFEIRDGTMVLEADIQREVALATCQREDTGIEQRRLSNTTSTIDDSLVALQDVTRQRFYLLCAAIKRLPFCVGHKTQPRIAVGTHSILY